MRVAKFRKRPIVVEAVKFIYLPDRMKELADFLPDGLAPEPLDSTAGGEYGIRIPTLEGEMIANEGDWIIKGVKGEFYPCKPEHFALTYEPIKG